MQHVATTPHTENNGEPTGSIHINQLMITINQPNTMKSKEINKKQSTKINNSKKRKHDIDDIDDINNGSPQNKKRKLNKLNKLNTNNQKRIIEDTSLMEEARQYKQERDEYEKERNHYKQQMEHYKDQMNYYKNKYLNLKERFVSFKEDQNIDTENEDDDINTNNTKNNTKNSTNNIQLSPSLSLNISNDKISSSPSPPPSQYFHKPPLKNNKQNISNKDDDDNNNDDEESEEDDESIYSSISNNSDYENDNIYIWEDCHYISVSCKICGDFFDDIVEYGCDLQYHFDNDPDKEWLKCNEYGCDPTKIYTKQLFMAHLHRHGHENPFHCKMKEFGGNKCKFTASTKGNMLSHLGSIKHNIILNESHNDTENDEEDDGYMVSVDCKYCGKHFNDFDEYINDLQQHFDNDPDKTWLICDQFGCDATRKYTQQTFIAHLCTHSHHKPFHCKLKTLDGKMCTFSAALKYCIEAHLKTETIHLTKEAKIDIIEINDTDDETLDDETLDDETLDNDNEYRFEDCHILSANCKYCGQHFDDFSKYTDHLKNHFDTDPSLEWLKCNEFGCDATKKWYAVTTFITHLCAHGHDRPFHCNMNKVDGTICTHSASSRINLIQHLKSLFHKIKVKPLKRQKRKKKQQIINNNAIWNDNDNDENMDISDGGDNEEYIPISDNEKTENYKYYIWEDCHTVSVRCKYCGQHFDDYGIYSLHLKNHFDTDDSKEWGECDEIECNAPKFTPFQFIPHLCRHGHQKPFHCKIKNIDGEICGYSASTKSNLIQHLKGKKHNIILNVSIQSKQKSIRDSDDDHDDEDYVSMDCYICNQHFDDLKKYQVHIKEHENNNNYIWEDCHFVAVDCKYCGKHLDDYDEYIDHLKQHFDSDDSKEWLKCNESGCDPTKKFPASQHFIVHLGTHGFQRPFHCNAKTLDGKKCQHSASSKGGIVTHLRTSIHKIKLKPSKSDIEKLENGNNYLLRNRRKEKQTKEGSNNDKKKNMPISAKKKWENCHRVKVNCKFCGKHFVDYTEYIDHLKDEFDIDESKEWLKCYDSGCDRNKIFAHTNAFISHLHIHGHKRPFHCKLKDLINGEMCSYSASSKSDLVRHLNTNKHNIKLKLPRGPKVKKRKKDKRKNEKECIVISDDEEEESEIDFVENESSDFKDSYYVSIDCHICKQHFDDMKKYKIHIERHYNNDKSRRWRQCDLGCKIDENSDSQLFGETSYDFIRHIASHTKHYPYKCNMRINGNKCKYSSAHTGNLKKHWQSHLKKRKDGLLLNHWDDET